MNAAMAKGRLNRFMCSLQAIKGIIALLDQLDSWIDEIPPLPTPQRFGNLAFRIWGKRLEEVGYSTFKSSCFFSSVTDIYPESFRVTSNFITALISPVYPSVETLFYYFVRIFHAYGLWDRT